MKSWHHPQPDGGPGLIMWQQKWNFQRRLSEGGKNELVPSAESLKTEGTSVKGVRVHGRSMTECTPPHRSASVLFLPDVIPPRPPSLPLCILEYHCEFHCGAESPSLVSAELHNENKWAGSKYAGCALPHLHTRRPLGFHQKMKMDGVAKNS